MIDQGELISVFLQVAQLARLPLAESDVRVEVTSAPHCRPRKLPKGTHGVYAFFLADKCLKVGKAGPKTAARFCSHHYGFHAPSTLAKSMLAHLEQVAALLPKERAAEVMALSEHSIGDWIEANTGRMNVLLPCGSGPFGLSLLEAFLQCRLRPIFEGRTA
jgi:hypothetical protein